MASNFPSSLDSFTNPSSSDAMDSVSVPHATQHSDLNDAVEALQAKVGADSSGVASSHDYKIAQLEGRDTAGLVHISRTTIGTAVSSVTVSGAFSADYDSYKIIVAGGAASTAVNLEFILGATTTGYTAAAVYNIYASPSAQGNAQVNIAHWEAGRGDTTALTLNMDVHSPFLTEYTTFQSAWSRAADAMAVVGGYLNNTTSYTGFTIETNTGTMTGGTIDVYGYAKA